LANAAVQTDNCRGNYLLYRGCVKSILPPMAAEYYLERRIIFEISRSEISKMMRLSKDNLARSAEKDFSHNPD
jgi:hypothetical protein